jgi:hypothetical protein
MPSTWSCAGDTEGTPPNPWPTGQPPPRISNRQRSVSQPDKIGNGLSVLPGCLSEFRAVDLAPISHSCTFSLTNWLHPISGKPVRAGAPPSPSRLAWASSRPRCGRCAPGPPDAGSRPARPRTWPGPEIAAGCSSASAASRTSSGPTHTSDGLIVRLVAGAPHPVARTRVSRQPDRHGADRRRAARR